MPARKPVVRPRVARASAAAYIDSVTRDAGGVSLSLWGLLGGSVERVRERLGVPVTDRRSGEDRWLLFRSGDLSVRLRCRRDVWFGADAGPEPDPGGGADGGAAADPVWRVASWTVSFLDGAPSLRAAAERVGLWPACAPDEAAPFRGPLLRRPLPGPAGDAVHSLTATVRDGRVVGITAFDEPPEWLPEEDPRRTPG